jgi:hypothetical protein
MGKLRRRAKALVDLEYGPQFNQIRDLFGQAETQYRNDRVGARETAKAVQAEAKASRPVVKDIYRDARKDLKSSNSFVDKAIATLDVPQTGLTGLLGQATQRERGTARTQNVAERRAALNDLVQRASSAEAGKALGYTLARQNLRSTNKDLTQRLVDLTGQSQSKLTALLGEMRTERAAVRQKAKEAQGKVNAAADKTITSGVFRGLTQGELDGMTAKEKQDWIKNHPTTTPKGEKKINVKAETNAYVNKINDAVSDWRRLAVKTSTEPLQRVKKDSGGKPVLDDKGNPIMQTVLDSRGNPVYGKPTPSQIREMMLAVRDDNGHVKYTPGDIHVALLVGNKPLDNAALQYLRRLRTKGIRIPHSWVTGPDPLGAGTGNPASSVGTGLG